MKLGKFLRAGFTGLEVVAIFALITGLVAGTKLVSQRQLTSTSASLCCNGGTCADGTPYGLDETTPHSSCAARTAQFCANKGGPGTGGSQCNTSPAPSSGSTSQCDNANSLYCREDGKAWWCNGNRQWEAGEGKSCSNKCSPTTSEASCSDSANYKDVGASCGNAGRCVANGSSNGFTSCRCDTSSTAPPPPAVPNALPSCSSPNTLLCVNGLSSWCNANSKLEVGTKTCSVNTCHPTSSGVGCADSNSYRSVGSTCNNGGKCQTTGSLNGFATCGCVTPQAPTATPTPATCTGNGGVYCTKATQLCTGGNSSKYDTATQYCCIGPASCKAKPPTAPQQICTPGAKISCEANGQVKSCNADGTGYVYDTCNNYGCNVTTKSCNACQPNLKTCSTDGSGITYARACKSDGSGWKDELCSFGCNQTTKACYTVCKPGTSACIDGASKTCNANGDGYSTITCGAKGCNNATGQCNSCESNKTRCSDSKTVATCNSTGTSESTRNCTDSCILDINNGGYTCSEDKYSSVPKCIAGFGSVPSHSYCALYDPYTQTCKSVVNCPTGQQCVTEAGVDQCKTVSAGNNFVSGETKIQADLVPPTSTPTVVALPNLAEPIAISPTPTFTRSAAVVVEQTRATVAGTIRSIFQTLSSIFGFRR